MDTLRKDVEQDNLTVTEVKLLMVKWICSFCKYDEEITLTPSQLEARTNLGFEFI